MHLQDAYRPHLADAAFNSLADCLGFVFAVGDNHDFFRVSDGADPDGQRCLGDEVDVIVEKTGVGFYGIHGQGFDAGARGQGRSRLVKRDMAVSADAADEKVDFAVALDFFFIITAFGFVVFGHAVQDVDVFRLDIDMFEKAFFHEKVVAFVVFRRRCRTGHIVNLVKFFIDCQRIDNIMFNKPEIRIIRQTGNVGHTSGIIIVNTQNPVAFADQTGTQI